MGRVHETYTREIVQRNSKYIFLLHLQCHLCGTFVLNFCLGGGYLFIYLFILRLRFGLGDSGRGTSAGDAGEDDELVRDRFSCFPCCSRVLIPLVKSSSRCRCFSSKPDFSLFPPSCSQAQRNDCVLAVAKAGACKNTPCRGTFERTGGEGDAEAMPAETEGIHVGG